MSLIVECLDRSRTIDQQVENWRRNHDQAMFARDVEGLVQAALQLAEQLREAWQKIKEEVVFSDYLHVTVCNDEMGEMPKSAARECLSVLEKVGGLVSQTESLGFALEGSPKLTEAIVTTSAIQREIENIWPQLDWETINQSLADFHSGNYLTLEEFMHETHGGRVGADQQENS